MFKFILSIFYQKIFRFVLVKFWTNLFANHFVVTNKFLMWIEPFIKAVHQRLAKTTSLQEISQVSVSARRAAHL